MERSTETGDKEHGHQDPKVCFESGQRKACFRVLVVKGYRMRKVSKVAYRSIWTTYRLPGVPCEWYGGILQLEE
jgi:hypothetical protein